MTSTVTLCPIRCYVKSTQCPQHGNSGATADKLNSVSDNLWPFFAAEHVKEAFQKVAIMACSQFRLFPVPNRPHRLETIVRRDSDCRSWGQRGQGHAIATRLFILSLWLKIQCRWRRWLEWRRVGWRYFPGSQWRTRTNTLQVRLLFHAYTTHTHIHACAQATIIQGDGLYCGFALQALKFDEPVNYSLTSLKLKPQASGQLN